MDEPHPEIAPFVKNSVRILVWCERAIFFIIGLMLFVAALALLGHAAIMLFAMFGSSRSPETFGAEFLDVILLVLMIVELAYTVMLSLRGAVLLAEPFLIVGLIGVIRRMLVVTVGDASGKTSQAESTPELIVLAGIVLVFVGSIIMLRTKSKLSFDKLEL